ENDVSGSVLTLRPVGVLPNNAEIRVVVLDSLEDIAGESNVGNAVYQPVVHRFRTRRDYGQQFDAVVADFDSVDAIDFTAAFPEPYAEVGPGFVRAGFEFEGSDLDLDY